MGVVAASAADLPAKPQHGAGLPAFTAADWSGFYLGGHAGWGAALSRGTNDDVDDNAPIDFGDTGFLYGAQAGYNWQFGRLVSGVEVDGTWGSLDANRTDNNGDQQRIETNFLASARLRSGAAIDNFWIYGTIGVGYAQSKFTVTGATRRARPPAISTGSALVSGFGAEYAIAPNWSLRAEYLYYAITKRSGLPNLTNDSDPTTSPRSTAFMSRASPRAIASRIAGARVAASDPWTGRAFTSAPMPATAVRGSPASMTKPATLAPSTSIRSAASAVYRRATTFNAVPGSTASRPTAPGPA